MRKWSGTWIRSVQDPAHRGKAEELFQIIGGVDTGIKKIDGNRSDEAQTNGGDYKEGEKFFSSTFDRNFRRQSRRDEAHEPRRLRFQRNEVDAILNGIETLAQTVDIDIHVKGFAVTRGIPGRVRTGFFYLRVQVLFGATGLTHDGFPLFQQQG